MRLQLCTLLFAATACHSGSGEMMNIDPNGVNQLARRGDGGQGGVGVSTGALWYSASNTNNADPSPQYRYNSNVLQLPLRMGETIQFTSCPGAWGGNGATMNGDTYFRVVDGSWNTLTYNDDSVGWCSSVVYSAYKETTVSVLLGCYGSGSCSGVAAYRIDYNSNGNPVDVPGMIADLDLGNSWNQSFQNTNEAHPKGTSLYDCSHTQSITRMPRWLTGQSDFFLNYSNCEGGGIGISMAYNDGNGIDQTTTFSRAYRYNPIAINNRPTWWNQWNITGGGSALDHPGGGQRIGGYLATATMDYRHVATLDTWLQIHRIDVPNAYTGDQVTLLSSKLLGWSDRGILFAAATKLQGTSIYENTSFPLGMAGGYLFATSWVGDVESIDFWYAPTDAYGWADPHSTTTHYAEVESAQTYYRAGQTSGTTGLKSGQNADLYTDTAGLVWLIVYAGDGTLIYYRVVFRDHPFYAGTVDGYGNGATTCPYDVCLERQQSASNVPYVSSWFNYAAGGYLADPSTFFLYTSEKGSLGGDEFNTREFAPSWEY